MFKGCFKASGKCYLLAYLTWLPLVWDYMKHIQALGECPLQWDMGAIKTTFEQCPQSLQRTGSLHPEKTRLHELHPHGPSTCESALI